MSDHSATSPTTPLGADPFDGHLVLGSRPALIVVDFVRAYIEPAAPLYAAVGEVELAIARLLDGFRSLGLPVVFSQVSYSPGGTDGGLFYRKVPSLKAFDRGSQWAEFGDVVRPRADELVITKQYASAFFGTSLATTLHTMGVDTLVITGVSTSGCVRATTLDALQFGFIPVVCREGVGDREVAIQEANLRDLGMKYAEVLGENEVVDWLDAVGDKAGKDRDENDRDNERGARP